MPQTSVPAFLPSGVVGEFYDDSPRRVDTYVINSPDATNNEFGRAFSILSEGIVRAGNAGTADFAGILITPKEHSLRGVAGNPLANTLLLPNGETAAFVTFGRIWVTLLNVGAIGNKIIYNNQTGLIDSVTPSTVIPSGFNFAYAKVHRFASVAPSNLCVIELNKYMTA